MSKPGRNDPCPCGSGKKYKKCCLPRQAVSVVNLNWEKMRLTEGELVPLLLEYSVSSYGPDAFAEAWDEFTLWRDVPIDPESELELSTAFLPWFVFNWIPDNAEVDPSEHLPEMTIAAHYAEEKGSRLDSYQRRFIEEICAQPYSFFVVIDVVPGEQMSLRDVFLRREITVLERQASTMLEAGSIIYSRIMTLDGDSIMVGCAPTIIPPHFLNEFIDIRENMAKKLPRLDREFLLDYDIELRGLYYDIREELNNPVPPHLENTDGDPLQLTKLHYVLQCAPDEALDALATLSLCSVDALLDNGEFDGRGELVSIQFPWLKKGNQVHTSWENTVMGHINIDGDRLTIDVNSQERADAVRRKVSRRLGKRAVFRDAVIQSSEKMLEDVRHNPTLPSAQKDQDELMALPEVQETLRAMADQHWKIWLDSPLPALKGQTPREAAKTGSGRERLEALLLTFESRRGEAQPFDPDVDALRQSLGLE